MHSRGHVNEGLGMHIPTTCTLLTPGAGEPEDVEQYPGGGRRLLCLLLREQ